MNDDSDRPPAATWPQWFEQLRSELVRAGPAAFRPFGQPPASGTRRSAVLMLFSAGSDPHADGAGPDVLLTERAHTLRSHPGQISFPGGVLEPGDSGPQDAALREATEEVGLSTAGVDVAALTPSLWIPVSGAAVTPVLGWWREPSPVGVVDVSEVASVARVPLFTLLNPAHRLLLEMPDGWQHPAFELGDLTIWGFTAAILDRLLHLSGLEQPWDRERIRPVPPEFLGTSRRKGAGR